MMMPLLTFSTETPFKLFIYALLGSFPCLLALILKPNNHCIHSNAILLIKITDAKKPTKQDIW